INLITFYTYRQHYAYDLVELLQKLKIGQNIILTKHKGKFDITNNNELYFNYYSTTLHYDNKRFSLAQGMRFIDSVYKNDIIIQYNITIQKTNITSTVQIEKTLLHLAQHPYSYVKEFKSMPLQEIYLLKHYNDRFNLEPKLHALTSQRILRILYYKYNIKFIPALHLSIPYNNLISIFQIKKFMQHFIQSLNITNYMKAILLTSFKFIYKKNKTIKQILCNHIRYAKSYIYNPLEYEMDQNNNNCICKGKKLIYDHNNCNQLSTNSLLPTILNMNSNNVPMPLYDTMINNIYQNLHLFIIRVKRYFSNEYHVPLHTIQELITQIKTLLQQNTHKINTSNYSKFPLSIADVNSIKRQLNGYIISTLDKNNNKLIITCPCVYQMQIVTTFINDSHYKKITNQTSDAIIHSWLYSYHSLKWDRFFPLAKQRNIITKVKNSDIPYAYTLMKFKDYKKLRPIVSYFQHPFKRLFKNVCTILNRLWKQLPDNVNKLALYNVSLFRERISMIYNKLYRFGPLTRFNIRSFDVKNMYTNLTHKSITDAIDFIFSIYAQMGRSSRLTVVSVHKRKKEFLFGRNFNSNDYNTYTFTELKYMIEFDLNNVYFKCASVILKQEHGIPMGGISSGPYANITCIYYEYMYFQSLTSNIVIDSILNGSRYMDDLIAIASFCVNDSHTCNQSLTLIEQLCNSYDENLELEEQQSENGTFIYLEALIKTLNDKIIIKPYMKNFPFIIENHKQKFLNIQHYYSYTPLKTKFGVIISTLIRLERNSSSYLILRHSVFKLYFELSILSYPFKFLLKAIYHIYLKNKQSMTSLKWKFLHEDLFRYRYSIKQLLSLMQPKLVAFRKPLPQLYDLSVDPG
ncbi:MAG TPA: hypothetical protein VN704_09685, partial [Verrucomicrobiae bacterium]|nr:hypothetical protein [Verrucomicrobiae bacterium]